MKGSETAPRWMTLAWLAWICAVIALFYRPFLDNLTIYRQVDPRLYVAMVVALSAGVIAATAYHFARRRGFWRWEPIVLPAAFLIFCAAYSLFGVLIALWITAAGYAAGRFALEKLGLARDAALSTLAGFGLFSVVLFVLGESHAFYPWIFALLLALPIALFWRKFRDLASELRAMHEDWVADPDVGAPQVSVAVFAAIVLAAIAATTLLTPAWNGDTIEMHLPLIRVFVASHSLTVPSAIPYGYYPQGFEVLASVAYSFGGQMAAQMVNPIFFCLAALVLYRIARACGVARSWAAAGVVLGISIPFVHWSGSVTKNDFALAAYQLAALLCWYRWRESRLFHWLVVSAFFMAMSFDIKHVAIFGAVPWALACIYSLWSEPKRFRRLMELAAIVVVFGLYWQLRAFIATGNPLAPLTLGVVREATGAHHTIWLLRGWDAHFTGKRNFQSPTQTPLGIVLLLLAPLWLIRRAERTNWRTEAVLWVFVVIYYALWTREEAVLRYALAPALLLAILGAARLALFRRSLAIPVMAVSLLCAAPIVVLIEMAPAQIPLFLKQIDAATFLRRTLAPYGAVEFLDRHASPADSIASVGDWAAAYSPNPANFYVLYSDSRKYSPEDIRRVLKPGDRYLILPAAPNLPELEAAVRENRALTRVYQDRDFVVDALQPKGR